MRCAPRSFLLDEVVLADALNQQEAAGCGSWIRYVVCGGGRNARRLADTDFAACGRIARLHHDGTFQRVIVIRGVGVMVPGNGLAGVEGVLAYQYVGAFCYDMDAADFIGLWFLAHGIPQSGLIPASRTILRYLATSA